MPRSGSSLSPFALTQQAVTKYLKVLERAGLVSWLRVAQARPCHLEMQHFAPAMDWITEQRRLIARRWTYPRTGRGALGLDEQVVGLVVRLARERIRGGNT
jgi:hypothetical protein